MAWSRRGSLVVYGLIALLAVMSLVVLFRLRNRFEVTMDERVADLQRVFSSRDLLKGPAETTLSFYEVENEVAKYEHRNDFGAIRIAKLVNGREHTVYPFYYPAVIAAGLNPNFEELNRDKRSVDPWQQYLQPVEEISRPLIADGEPLGALYVEVNRGPLRVVSLVIWALAGMLAASLAFIASQFRRQEKVISATTIELEEKRRELVRLERLALAGQLSANILHDLKKPVLNIRNEADEALDPSVPSEEPTPSLLNRIREQADFFLGMLKEAGFDRFVRAGEDKEYVDLTDLMDRSIALVRYEQGSVQVQRRYAPGVPAVLADPIRLIQVFSNLILNAYQAMNGRGILRVEAVHAEPDIIIRITDNGPGIPPEVLSHIFEPFYTTKPAGQGTGLGLYIVRDILTDMGARVELTSKPGHTVFTLYFPVAE